MNGLEQVRDFEKVYIVVSSDPAGYGVFIDAAFTTKEEAEKFAKEISGRCPGDEYFVWTEIVYRTAEEALKDYEKGEG